MINNLNEPEYPKSWEVVKLGDFAESEKGKKPKNQQAIQDDVFTLPYIDIEAFEKNIFNSFTDGEKCVLCSEDDFLMVWDGSRSGLVGKGLNGALGSTLVRINLPMINNLYGYYYLQSKYLEINTRAKGVGIPHVDPALLWNYDFPIPPVNEQKRIVDKIETLFSEVDAGIANLTLAKRQLEQYRQSLLKHAFEGKLTAEWRENYAKHTGKSLLTADELLTQIQTARQAHYDQQIKEWEKSVKAWEKEGKNGRKPSKPRKLGEIEILESGRIPQNWIKTYTESTCDFITKGTTPSKENLSQYQGEIPFIKVYNLTKIGKLDFSINPTFTNSETHNSLLSRSKVYPNDILMNIVGPPLGKVSVVPKDYPEWNINQAIVVFRPLYTKIDYFKFFLLSHQTINLMAKQGKATAGQFNLTLEICRKLPIPICSTEEQALIVSILDTKLSVIEKNIHDIILQLEKATLLKTSILHKAFQGKLVPQDPNDPPASELLEQIKAERKAQALAEQQAKDANKKSKSTSKRTPKKKAKAKVKTKATETQSKSAKIDTDDATIEQGQIKLPL